MIKNYDAVLVVGTRPNFIKAAPLLEFFEKNDVKTLFIHTGQHKDKNMSSNIFEDLNIRKPDIFLDTPTTNINKQTTYIVDKLDTLFDTNKSEYVGVFGDVTSTLAAAMSTKNKKMELFHVEAGLRSRNMDMPEERNRIMVDSISDYLFAPSDGAVENLNLENLPAKYIGNVGNIMIDTLEKNLEQIIDTTITIKKKLKIDTQYFVVTIHRPSNLSDENLENIFNGLKTFSKEYKIILPAHPRLKKYISKNNVKHENILIIDPLSYIDFLGLVNGSKLVLTDSGGLQEETTHLNVKCLTIRNETERPITVSEGTNKVIGVNTEIIISEINNAIESKLSVGKKIKFWDGETSSRIYKELFE
ncbi:UDP-N-acetylglucosamine 2-epimerase (non-hydrolyzing) [Acidimicrobiaceae bacterium]|nr:UDP-N-acetylglucosamine 2-epimerase (non-hydrolyzing) [Acidimicrobiaceae bacterium]